MLNLHELAAVVQMLRSEDRERAALVVEEALRELMQRRNADLPPHPDTIARPTPIQPRLN